MNRKVIVPVVLVAVLGLVAASLNLSAAPILRGRQNTASIPDPTRSLKGIRKVQLNIKSIAASVIDAGLTMPIITKQWTERLKASGFEIVDDPSAPLLSLFVNEIGDPAIRDAKGYIMTLHVIQTVKVDRMDMTLNVPTFVYMIAGMEVPENLPASVRATATSMIDVFIRSVQVADQAD